MILISKEVIDEISSWDYLQRLDGTSLSNTMSADMTIIENIVRQSDVDQFCTSKQEMITIDCLLGHFNLQY